jgi:hypothetical protein
MKLNDLDMARLSTAQPLPVFQPTVGRRGALAALMARLVNAWVGLYAPPPRRPLPML